MRQEIMGFGMQSQSTEGKTYRQMKLTNSKSKLPSVLWADTIDWASGKALDQ